MGEGKMDVPTQTENEFALSLSFVLFRASTDWMMSIHISEGGSSLFILLTRMLISSRNTLTATQK